MVLTLLVLSLFSQSLLRTFISSDVTTPRKSLAGSWTLISDSCGDTVCVRWENQGEMPVCDSLGRLPRYGKVSHHCRCLWVPDSEPWAQGDVSLAMADSCQRPLSSLTRCQCAREILPNSRSYPLPREQRERVH